MKQPEKKLPVRKKINEKALFVSALLVLYLHSIVFGSLEVYLQNTTSFISYSITFLLIMILIGGVCLTLLGLFFATILPKRLLSFFSAAFSGFAIIAYGERLLAVSGNKSQDMIFQLAYIAPKRIIVSMLFLFVMYEVVKFVLRTKRQRRFLQLALWLLAINLAALMPGLLREIPDFKIRPVLDKSIRFDLSKNQNVIVFILDTFQADAFAEITESHSEIAKVFKDFDYFPDVVGCHRETYPSIPCYLSGKQYDNSVHYQTFLDAAFDSQSLPAQLKQRGFRNHVYESPFGIPYDLDLFDSVKPAVLAKDKFYDFTVNLITGLYRTSPAFVKSLYNPMDLVQRADVAFHNTYYPNDYGFDLLTQENFNDIRLTLKFLNFADKVNDQPVFSYYHFNGVHLPLTMGQGFQKNQMAETRENYLIVAANQLKLMQLLIERLKEIGLYDTSTIVIAGDHGAYFDIGLNRNTKVAKLLEEPDTTALTSELPLLRTAGIPLLVIKPPLQEQESLHVNLTPVSMVDFTQIMLTVVDSGSLKNMPTNESRFYYYSDGSPVSTMTHRAPMTKYEVTGPSWYMQSWKKLDGTYIFTK